VIPDPPPAKAQPEVEARGWWASPFRREPGRVYLGKGYWTTKDLRWAALSACTGAILAVVISIAIVEVLGR